MSLESGSEVWLSQRRRYSIRQQKVLILRRLRSSRLDGRGPWCGEEPDLAAFVYLLRCADGRYYVGSTRKSLEARVAEHNAGALGGFTASRLPVVLVWSQAFDQVTDAIAMERRIKGWSRAKKEALIAGDFEAISSLASRRGG